MISECKLNLLFPLSQLPLVKFGKFQCPSWTEFPKFSGTPLTLNPYVILKVFIANQRSIFGRPVLRWGTVHLLEEWIHSLFALPSDIDSFYWHRAHLTRPDMSHMVHLSLTLPCHMLVPTLLPPHTGQGVWPQPPQPRHTRSTPALSRSGDSSRLSSPDSLSLTRPASSWSIGVRLLFYAVRSLNMY